LLYAVHPLRSEAVCSVGFREDLLCGLFVFGALAAWPPLRGVRPACGAGVPPANCRDDSALEHGRWHLSLRLSLALMLFVLALLSKEMALSFPVLVLAWDLRGARPGSPEWRVWTRRRAPWHVALWLIAAGALALTLSFAGPKAGFNVLTPAPLGRRLAAFAWIVLRYLGLFLWPHPLSVDHLVDPAAAGVWTAGLGSAVALAVLLVLAWRRRGVFAPAWMALCAFLILLAPVSDVVPLAHPMAERYLTMPVAALCFLAASVWGRLPWRGVRLALLGIALAACLALSWQRCRDWETDLKLWVAEVRHGAVSSNAYNNVGSALLERGQFDQAVAVLQQAVARDPDASRPRVNLGCAFFMQQKLGPAEEQLRRALEINAESASAHAYLAAVLVARGDRPGALRECDAALGCGDPDVRIHTNVGSTYLNLSETDRAIEQFRIAVAGAPRDAWGYRGLARALQVKGQYAEGAAVCRRGLAVQPGNADLRDLLQTSLEAAGRPARAGGVPQP
jgi:tetratricopeptide (TPR) repeat protein